MRPSRMASDQRAAIPAGTLPHERPSWHVLSEGEVARQFVVDPSCGLTTADSAQRALRYGPNALREPQRRAPWRMLVDQFTDFMILVLIAAAVVSGFIGEPEDAVA